MDEYAVVINAGSSSLKFCVYRRPPDQPWVIESRGQIEGIGTSPRFTAKDGEGKSVLDRQLDTSVNDGKKALGAVADWLQGLYAGATVRGVGHRIVHGGAKYTGPTIVTPDVLVDLRTLIPLAPLHQPYNLQ